MLFLQLQSRILWLENLSLTACKQTVSEIFFCHRNNKSYSLEEFSWTLLWNPHMRFLQILYLQNMENQNPKGAKLATLSVFKKWAVSMTTVQRNLICEIRSISTTTQSILGFWNVQICVLIGNMSNGSICWREQWPVPLATHSNRSTWSPIWTWFSMNNTAVKVICRPIYCRLPYVPKILIPSNL